MRGLLGSLVVVSIVTASGASAVAQSQLRTVTTTAALTAYPVFFHAREVVLRATLVEDRAIVTVKDAGERPILAVARRPLPTESEQELRGEFLDLGRLEPDDPRLEGLEIRNLIEPFTGGRWPGREKVFLLRVLSTSSATPLAAPSIRALAIDPTRYEGQRVTVSGRFRGFNLYGDLPKAPGKSKWDFVLQSADAAVWVTGKRPRGSGFNLDPEAKVDTGQWLEVSGVVQNEGPQTWIEAQDIRLSKPPQETEPAAVVETPAPLPPPHVIFSVPTQDEVDVPTTATVRIQFSQDMQPASFKNRVRARYIQAAGSPAPPTFTIAYMEGPRVLELRLAQPLARFSVVAIDLEEGIVSTTGGTLKPWTLTFAVGGTDALRRFDPSTSSGSPRAMSRADELRVAPGRVEGRLRLRASRA